MQIQRATYSLDRVVSKSATYTATLANDDIICSGASWSLTLPTPVGIQGKIFTIYHQGTTVSQQYTLLHPGVTLGGIASGSYILWTNGEILTIMSDGANWVIMNHKTATTPVSWTPTYTALGTVTGDENYWWREGNIFRARGRVTSPGSSAGSEARLSLLSGLTTATVTGFQIAGFVMLEGSSSQFIMVYESAKTYLAFCNATTNPFTKVNGTAVWSASGIDTLWDISVPIVGWRP